MLVSQGTRAVGVWVGLRSRMGSEIWWHTLSGWPSVRHSLFHRNLAGLWKLVVNYLSLSRCLPGEPPDPSKGAQAKSGPEMRPGVLDGRQWLAHNETPYRQPRSDVAADRACFSLRDGTAVQGNGLRGKKRQIA